MNTEQRQITVVQSAVLPPPPPFLANTRLCNLFLGGLISRRVQDRILRDCVGRQVPTLERAIQLALQFEQLARIAEQYHQPRQGEPRSQKKFSSSSAKASSKE
ncbi:hypothetical protein HPB47_016682 [Ixodes persulcatus]|uniref:Uncharacterized protein n=1 Tax=Ixodes persulcatus TaxID=34615 RepID=A0AC60QQG4_IXOPE|nr:hypothetical protein HPB47_016682 [Ixodes persulcatus]